MSEDPEVNKELASWNTRRMADDVEGHSPEEGGRFYEGWKEICVREPDVG